MRIETTGTRWSSTSIPVVPSATRHTSTSSRVAEGAPAGSVASRRSAPSLFVDPLRLLEREPFVLLPPGGVTDRARHAGRVVPLLQIEPHEPALGRRERGRVEPGELRELLAGLLHEAERRLLAPVGERGGVEG